MALLIFFSIWSSWGSASISLSMLVDMVAGQSYKVTSHLHNTRELAIADEEWRCIWFLYIILIIGEGFGLLLGPLYKVAHGLNEHPQQGMVLFVFALKTFFNN